MSTKKSIDEKIAEAQAKLEQAKNQLKRLESTQKESERKARTHRLCKRGGLWESLAPDTIGLTDEQFKTFLEKTILTEYARRILNELIARNAAAPAPQAAETAARGNVTDTVEARGLGPFPLV